ncbi:hypothetical protein BV898_06958 [Hypsibius exemplaris]|uniref:Disks large-associated protein 1 n=1 Tax=Hypsibius exemplaris TaxID=2072580 RepID=A0A1W0WUM1_HYPEX|nr:hypothetical protein BV898_06958 [Hypsibius exemplaris]
MAMRIQNGSGRTSRASQASSSTTTTTKINFASSPMPPSSSEPSEISKDSPSIVSSSLSRDGKPLKGILMNQGFRSQDPTPNSSPRAAVPDSSLPHHRNHHESPASVSSSSVDSPLRKVDQQAQPQPPPTSQKRSMTSNAVADFLKKFSPKLTRSKKSLQWYTVDIQPSGAGSPVQFDKFSSSGSRNSADLETDPTVRELQAGRISSEFSSEMSECLSSKNLDLKSRSLPVGVAPPGVVASSSGAQSARSAASRTAQDRTDFLKSGPTSARTSNKQPINGQPTFSSPVSKSMPATPVAHNNHHQTPSNQDWRMMMVDIDVDRKDGQSEAARQRKMEYLGDLTAHLRMYPQSTTSAPTSAERALINNHVPSYIRLSRALNGYSARNMYASKKVNRREEFLVKTFCRSEEVLNRPSSRSELFCMLDEDEESMSLNAPRAPPMSARDLRNQPTRDDIRRAASEGRDLSGISKGRAVLVEIPDSALAAPAVPEKVTVPTSEKAGHAFLSKLEAEMDKLRQLCLKGQQDLDAELDTMPEEVKENLRSAVGKTNLLLSQKCKQFADLCKKNIAELPDEVLKTTPEDLEGFWDLLCIQITKCNGIFRDVYHPKSITEGDPRDSHDSPDAAQKTKVAGRVESRSGSRRSSSNDTAAAAVSGVRRSSKPKVTFQLTEKDVQRKEMIAAKRREFEQQQIFNQVPASLMTTAVKPAAEQDVHFFVPSSSSVSGN